MTTEDAAAAFQLIANALALGLAGWLYKAYVQSLRAALVAKDEQAEAIQKAADFWREKALELEKRSPERMEEILTTRIKTREEEINRLQEDKEAHQRELHVKTQELASLKSSLLKTVDVRKSIDLFALSEDGADITNEDDELEIEQIGFVAVDSGQLMITDPCYIDSEWGREEFEDVRLFRDVETGSILQFGRDFGRFDEAPEGYSASVSDLVTAGRFERLELDTSRRRTFSYAGACYATSVRTVLAN